MEVPSSSIFQTARLVIRPNPSRSPALQERVGIWQHGPRFKVYLTGNLRQLMASFERHYDVPPQRLAGAVIRR